MVEDTENKGQPELEGNNEKTQLHVLKKRRIYSAAGNIVNH